MKLQKLTAYKTREGYGILEPLTVKREWMDETWEAHAYKCFPVSLSNTLGWGISFPEDITFIWDGISDSSSEHVKILSGEKYVSPERGNATISFNTGIMFVSDENLTLLSMPVPNFFRRGISPFTTLISTSFFAGDLPAAWRLTEPNIEITIKANTPVIAILPIDLENLQNSEIQFDDLKNVPASKFNVAEYGNIVYQINRTGKWTNFYRDAVDHLGNMIGKHQVKTIRLNVKDK